MFNLRYLSGHLRHLAPLKWGADAAWWEGLLELNWLIFHHLSTDAINFHLLSTDVYKSTLVHLSWPLSFQVASFCYIWKLCQKDLSEFSLVCLCNRFLKARWSSWYPTHLEKISSWFEFSFSFLGPNCSIETIGDACSVIVIIMVTWVQILDGAVCIFT